MVYFDSKDSLFSFDTGFKIIQKNNKNFSVTNKSIK